MRKTVCDSCGKLIENCDNAYAVTLSVNTCRPRSLRGISVRGSNTRYKYIDICEKCHKKFKSSEINVGDIHSDKQGLYSF